MKSELKRECGLTILKYILELATTYTLVLNRLEFSNHPTYLEVEGEYLRGEDSHSISVEILQSGIYSLHWYGSNEVEESFSTNYLPEITKKIREKMYC